MLGSDKGIMLKHKEYTGLPLWRTDGNKAFLMPLTTISLHWSVVQWDSRQTEKAEVPGSNHSQISYRAIRMSCEIPRGVVGRDSMGGIVSYFSDERIHSNPMTSSRICAVDIKL